MSLKETLSAYWLHVQEELLPWRNDTTCGPLNEHHKQLVSVLGMARTCCPAGIDHAVTMIGPAPETAPAPSAVTVAPPRLAS